MKQLLTILTLLVFSIFLTSCKSVNSDSSMKQHTGEIKVAGELKLDKEGAVELIGKGFAPSQKLVILFTTEDGVQSDIGYALKPEPIADTSGALKTEWSYGRFVKKKLVKEGRYTLTVADEDFNELASTGVVFVK